MKASRLTGWQVFLFLLLFPFRGMAQEAGCQMLVLSPGDKQYRAGRYDFQDYLYLFVDSTGERTIEEVAAPCFQLQFSREERRRPHYFAGDPGPELQPLWGRIIIFSRLEQDERWLINLDAGEVDLFVPVDSSGFAHHSSGNFLPMEEMTWQGHNGRVVSMPLLIPAGDTLTVFFKQKGTGFAMGIQPAAIFGQTLFRPEVYLASARRIRFLDAMVLGALLAVCIYHLVLFLYQRRKVLLFFSFFVFWLGVHFALSGGYVYEFPFPGFNVLNGFLPVSLCYFGIFLFHYLFSRSCLQLPGNFPVWDKAWGLFILFDLVILALLAWIILPEGGLWETNRSLPSSALLTLRGYLNISLFLFSIGAGIAAWLRGHKGAGIYLFGTLVFILLEVGNRGELPFLLPWVLWGSIGPVVMVFVFAVGVAHRLQALREERFAAAQEKIAERAEAHRIRELDAFKSRFYANITHQLRTPLTIILGMADQIQAHPSAWYDKGADMIRRNGRRLLRLIDQILSLSRLEAGQLPVHLVRDDVIRHLRYIVESFHSPAARKNIKLRFSTSLTELVMDYDPDKWVDILSNLLSNAIRYTRHGGTVRVRAWTKKGARNTFHVQVSDNGPGISAEALPGIFDRFYQAGRQPRGEHGAGIGLALTQELVRLLGGEIRADSEPGKGASFLITLPITRNAPIAPAFFLSSAGEEVLPQAASAQAAGLPDTGPSLPGRPTLLLVEDNSDLLEYLRALLGSRFNLGIAYNGKQGREKALRYMPDIIISDILMPEMDGLELCRQLKEDKRTSHIPVIILTPKADTVSRIEGLRSGADACLAKPFNQTELLVRIDKLIELRAQLHERYRDLQLIFQPLQALPEKDIHPEDHFMRELHSIIEANLSDPDFNVHQLCEQLGMSRSALYKKFKTLTGQSIADFIRRVRLHKARQLLESTGLNVTQVAMDAGFKNLSTFSRCFSEVFGMPPSEVKKNLA